MPTLARRNTIAGSSNNAPHQKAIDVTKAMYVSMESTGVSVPRPIPNRNRNDTGSSTTYANATPATNKTLPHHTNASPQDRSCGVSPVRTNPQICARMTGMAKIVPARHATFI